VKGNGLQGRVAVITGAGRGLGKAMAVALAGEGVRIALVARSQDELTRTAGEITQAGGDAAPFVADVTSEEHVRRAQEAVLAHFGTVNILINNAGLYIRRPVTELSLDEWRAVMDTNVTSAYLLCHAFVPHMKGQAYGRVLNVASTMAWISLPGRTA